MHDLGTLNVSAAGPTWHAIRWSSANGMSFLGDLGGNFSWANFIGDNGLGILHRLEFVRRRSVEQDATASK